LVYYSIDDIRFSRLLHLTISSFHKITARVGQTDIVSDIVIHGVK